MIEKSKQFMELLNLAITNDMREVWHEDILPKSLEEYGWDVEELRANKLVFSFNDVSEIVRMMEDPDYYLDDDDVEFSDEFIEDWQEITSERKAEDFEDVLFFEKYFARKFFYETLFKMYMEVVMDRKLSATGCFIPHFNLEY